MTDHARNGWQRFWDRGHWWQPFLAAIAYLLVYNGIGLLVSTLFAGLIDRRDVTGSPASAFFGVALPILLGGLVLLAFVASLGWSSAIFRRRSRGPGWMWIAVVLLIIPIGLRVAATDWSAFSIELVLTILLLGLCVGLAEELISRGVAVESLRRGAHSERTVMVLSSAVFALLHTTNLLAGQAPITVAITVVYTFGFGVMMYLALRVTGTIIAPMLLHAATDPTTILATGGIDAHGANAGSGGLIAIAGIFNYLYLALAIVALFLVKGRVAERAERP